jgi:ATP-dependent protease ClpP protease subunit
MREIFIARYEENGITRSVAFNKSKFNKESAEEWLNNKGIKNFWFFFEPNEPKPFGENGIIFSGEVGFDITLDRMTPYLDAGNEIILDSFGGDSWEGLKIHDAIKLKGNNPSIGVLGSCMSATMQILLATQNRWMSENSRGLIHNPWTWAVGDDDVFKKEAVDLEKEKLQIASIYVQASGKDLDYILSLMKEERILRADEMLSLNFVKSIRGNIANNNNNDDNDMNKEQKEKMSAMEKTLNAIKNLFSSPKSLVIQDVNGVELDFGDEIETVDQIQVGSTATVDGSPAVGDYVVEDGTTYKFEAGAITEIVPPADDAGSDAQVEELQAEVENLTTENSTLKAQVTKLTNANEKLQNTHNSMSEKFKTVQADFLEFKNKFADDIEEPPTPEVEGDGKKKKFSYKSKTK